MLQSEHIIDQATLPSYQELMNQFTTTIQSCKHNKHPTITYIGPTPMPCRHATKEQIIHIQNGIKIGETLIVETAYNTIQLVTRYDPQTKQIRNQELSSEHFGHTPDEIWRSAITESITQNNGLTLSRTKDEQRGITTFRSIKDLLYRDWEFNAKEQLTTERISNFNSDPGIMRQITYQYTPDGILSRAVEMQTTITTGKEETRRIVHNIISHKKQEERQYS